MNSSFIDKILYDRDSERSKLDYEFDNPFDYRSKIKTRRSAYQKEFMKEKFRKK